jgi:predicted regulator of Ras-like GTPase activity (Roadblock/LC7/MglB family)
MIAPPIASTQRDQQIRLSLDGLNTSSAEIEASALISIDGLLIDAAMPAGMDEDRIGAMSAALLSLGERTARELGRGQLERVLIQGEHGYVIMTSAGKEAVLTVLTKAEVKLGLAFLDIKRAAHALSRIL